MKGVGHGAVARAWHAWWLVVLVACFVLIAIVPPFQAPDEIDHVSRAALLANGQLLLQRSGGAVSGGEIDSGLATYALRMFPLGITVDKRMDAGEQAGLDAVRWSGRKHMVYPSGTSYYFPALYLPQSTGLMIGKHLGWTVSASYLLARFLSLATAMALFALAFHLYRPPPLVLALLSLPMTLYVLSGAVLDGMATAVAVVALSAYMRLFTDGERGPRWVALVLVAAVAMVAACRPNVLPFLVLPLAAGWMVRDRRTVWFAVTAIVFVLAWTLFTIKFTVYPEGATRGNQAGKLIGYVLHPSEFFDLLYETFIRVQTRQFLGRSFVGILGWLTVALPTWVYPLFGVVLLGILLLGVSRDVVKTFPWARLLLICCAVAATLLSFLALLVQWPQVEQGVITGVQGRYLLIPALATAYALSGASGWLASLRHHVALCLVAALLGIGVFSTITVLIGRYYLAPMRYHQPKAPVATKVEASPQLSRSHSIALHFDDAQRARPQSLVRLSIDMATYARTNSGQAILRLRTVDGATSEYNIDLSSLEDNQYAEFLLDGKRYVDGEISLKEGDGGISAWEAHTPDGDVVTCMVYATTDGQAEVAPACPVPRP